MAAGVAPSPKHFPGHGDTHVDSHLALPVIDKPIAALLATELPPFQSLIDAGCATIMTGHMALPQVTGDNTPSSLSRKITTDLLRDHMRFDGVVVTDCLEMEAVVEGYGSETGAAMAFSAGADVAMICHTFERQSGAVIKTYEAVEKGSWSPEELKASGERIKKLKDRFVGNWEDALGIKFDDARLEALKKHNLELSKAAYAASVAVIRGPLPIITKEDAVLVLTPEMESLNKAVDDAEGVLRTDGGQVRNTAGPSYLALAALVAKRVEYSRHIVYSPHNRFPIAPADIKAASYIIFVSRNADRSPWQIYNLEYAFKEKDKNARVVVLQSCAPYDLLNFVDQVRQEPPVPSLGCFEFTPPALESAAQVLFGETEAKGKVPVLGGKVVG